MRLDVTRDPLVVLEPERILDHQIVLAVGSPDDTRDEPESRQDDDSNSRPGKAPIAKLRQAECREETEGWQELHVVVRPVEAADVDPRQRRDEPDEPQPELERLFSGKPEPEERDRREWKQVSRRRRQRSDQVALTRSSGPMLPRKGRRTTAARSASAANGA